MASSGPAQKANVHNESKKASGASAAFNRNTLTLGWEFEFVMMHHCPYEDRKAFRCPERSGRELIAEALKEPHEVSCADRECRKKNVKFECQLSVANSNGTAYNVWQVGSDPSAKPQVEDLLCLDRKKGNKQDGFQGDSKGKLKGDSNDDSEYSTTSDENSDENVDEKKNEKRDLMFEPIQVRSRILRFDERVERMGDDQKHGKHQHWITYQDEITLVLDILNRCFGFGRFEIKAQAKEMRDKHTTHAILETNRSGFHVHIGNGPGVSVPFPTVKNVLSVFVACERLLDRLSGTRDITGINLIAAPKARTLSIFDKSDCFIKYAYNRPVSACLIFAVHTRRIWQENPDLLNAKKGAEYNRCLRELYPQERAPTISSEVMFGMDIHNWLILVDGAKDMNDIRDLTCFFDKNCTINLKNLRGVDRVGTEESIDQNMQSGRELRTIEFRQHAGTLLPLDALSFIDLMANLTLCCHDDRRNDLMSGIKLGGKFRVPHPMVETALDLVKFIGCKQKTFEFYRRQMTGKGGDVAEKLNFDEGFISKHESQIPGARFALHEIGGLCESIEPGNVEELVMEKLLESGYGKFSDKDLQTLLPSDTPTWDRERLVIPVKSETGPDTTQSKVSAPLARSKEEDDSAKATVPKGSVSLNWNYQSKGEGSARHITGLCKSSGEASKPKPNGGKKMARSHHESHEDRRLNGKKSANAAGTRKGLVFISHHV